MTGRRTSMNKLNEIKRLLELKLPERTIARSLQVSRNTVAKVRLGNITQQQEANTSLFGQGWPLLVDWEKIKEEYLSGICLSILWEELKQAKTIHVNYSSFWKHFNKKFPKIQKSMHRVFAPGSRIEIDYCDGISFYNPITGEIANTNLFVGVLCYSRYTFAEFSLTQKSQDFLNSHIRMFEYFGGVSQVISPDNLKSAVTKAHKYEPDLNPAYTRLAAHYEVGIVPARVRTPKR